MRAAAMLAIAVSAIGCSKEPRVSVECRWAAFGATCTLTRLQGSEGRQVCWDVNVSCTNGARVSSAICQDAPIGEGTSIARNVAWPEFTATEKCDAVQSSGVENIRLIR